MLQSQIITVSATAIVTPPNTSQILSLFWSKNPEIHQWCRYIIPYMLFDGAPLSVNRLFYDLDASSHFLQYLTNNHPQMIPLLSQCGHNSILYPPIPQVYCNHPLFFRRPTPVFFDHIYVRCFFQPPPFF